MKKNHKEAEPTQRTEKGHEIPVPEKKDVLRDLTKIAKSTENADSGRERGE